MIPTRVIVIPAQFKVPLLHQQQQQMFKRKKYSWLHFDFIMTPLRVVRPPLFWHLPQWHPEVWSITWSLSLDSRNLNNPIQLHRAGQEKRILLLYVNDEITLLQSGRDLDTLSFFFGEKHVFFFIPQRRRKKNKLFDCNQRASRPAFSFCWLCY